MTAHYEVEDEVPQTVETQIELYQQSRAVVKDGNQLAERILGEAGPLMEMLYNAASAAQDVELMATVNDAWSKTQELAKAVGQQDAALNGADATIAVLKANGEKILQELDVLKTGLHNLDADAHPLLEQFRNTIEAEAVKDALNDYFMFGEDDAFDMEEITDRVYDSLEPLLDDVRFVNRKQVCEALVDILFGNDAWDDAQGELLSKLLISLQKDPKRAAIETAEDYEEIEE